MSEYADISFEAEPKREPFRFRIFENKENGKLDWEEKFELPALDDPGLPVGLISFAMLAISDKPDESKGREGFEIITAWLTDEHPRIVRALNRHSQTAPVLMGLVKAWAAHSEADPKA